MAIYPLQEIKWQGKSSDVKNNLRIIAIDILIGLNDWYGNISVDTLMNFT